MERIVLYIIIISYLHYSSNPHEHRDAQHHLVSESALDSEKWQLDGQERRLHSATCCFQCCIPVSGAAVSSNYAMEGGT